MLANSLAGASRHAALPIDLFDTTMSLPQEIQLVMRQSLDSTLTCALYPEPD